MATTVVTKDVRREADGDTPTRPTRAGANNRTNRGMDVQYCLPGGMSYNT
jgi:hypothetical protein